MDLVNIMIMCSYMHFVLFVYPVNIVFQSNVRVSVLGPMESEEESADIDTSAGRFVRYQFTPAFLKLRTVGAT